MTITELRKATLMTRRQFSDYLKIPYRTLSDWEHGLRNPPEYVVELIEYKLRNENLIK